MNDSPILFFAFSNSKTEDLRYLPIEKEGIRSALEEAQDNGLCKVIFRYNATFDDIVKVFQKFKDQIAVFHFSGHANDYALFLENDFGNNITIYAKGFSGYLGDQKGLQLVFLNGCATQQQSLLLHDNGVPVVISTSDKVDDSMATETGIRFYQQLGKGDSIVVAYHKTISLLKSQGWQGEITVRGLWAEKKQIKSSTPLWELEAKPGFQRTKNWSLLEAANRPLYNLPILSPKKVPPAPFPYTKAYSPQLAWVFGGRGYEIKKIYDEINEKNTPSILLLYGTSGVGKTSLLQAGLLPRIPKKQILLATEVKSNNRVSIKKQLSDLIKQKFERPSENKFLVVLDGLDEHSLELIPLICQIICLLEESVIFVLAMRTAYVSQWEAALNKKASYKSIILPPLSKRGMIRFLKNICATKQYMLTIDEELQVLLINLFHRDHSASITPIFQVLMYSLWEKAKAEAHSSPHFSIPLFRELEDQGIWETFLYNQLANLDTQAFKSGLLFNLLQDASISIDGFSNKAINPTKIINQYKHVASSVTSLLEGLCSKNILNNPSTDRLEEANKVRLSHALLHVPLLHLLEHSVFPGQEARRILAYHQYQKTLLNSYQIKTVKGSLSAIPDLSKAQKKLIYQSKKQVQKAFLINFRIGLFVGILFLLVIYPNIHLVGFLITLVILYR